MKEKIIVNNLEWLWGSNLWGFECPEFLFSLVKQNTLF